MLILRPYRISWIALPFPSQPSPAQRATPLSALAQPVAASRGLALLPFFLILLRFRRAEGCCDLRHSLLLRRHNRGALIAPCNLSNKSYTTSSLSVRTRSDKHVETQTWRQTSDCVWGLSVQSIILVICLLGIVKWIRIRIPASWEVPGHYMLPHGSRWMLTVKLIVVHNDTMIATPKVHVPKRDVPICKDLAQHHERSLSLGSPGEGRMMTRHRLRCSFL